MVVHVLLQQLVTFANVHSHTQVPIVKDSLCYHHLDQPVLVLFVLVQHPRSLSSIHAYQIHVKTMVVVLLLSIPLDAIVHLVTLVTIVNSVSKRSMHVSENLFIEIFSP